MSDVLGTPLPKFKEPFADWSNNIAVRVPGLMWQPTYKKICVRIYHGLYGHVRFDLRDALANRMMARRSGKIVLDMLK
jgi:hypothetical protein